MEWLKNLMKGSLLGVILSLSGVGAYSVATNDPGPSDEVLEVQQRVAIAEACAKAGYVPDMLGTAVYCDVTRKIRGNVMLDVPAGHYVEVCRDEDPNDQFGPVCYRAFPAQLNN